MGQIIRPVIMIVIAMRVAVRRCRRGRTQAHGSARRRDKSHEPPIACVVLRHDNPHSHFYHAGPPRAIVVPSRIGSANCGSSEPAADPVSCLSARRSVRPRRAKRVPYRFRSQQDQCHELPAPPRPLCVHRGPCIAEHRGIDRLRARRHETPGLVGPMAPTGQRRAGVGSDQAAGARSAGAVDAGISGAV